MLGHSLYSPAAHSWQTSEDWLGARLPGPSPHGLSAFALWDDSPLLDRFWFLPYNAFVARIAPDVQGG